MKKTVVLPLLILSMFLFGGCGSTGATQKDSTNPNPKSIPAQNLPATSGTTNVQNNNGNPTPTAVSGMINIQNFAFSPTTLTIKKGATVTWTNNDSAPHQIKSATFNSSEMSKGQSFSFTFNTVGSFDYFCSIHPSMMGKIIVE